ncbi:non-hydrolyzing UDP-N-acetylglucosamine 2-epimerase [Flavobacterium sp. JP2137]|uniref:non-hydrolyzing UDP-N-acetylglucosamine 2-epimerase n=1 Tax=Flavobacterium sp. JP2137 TaxID=3414510 RepID=UPI003D2FA68D
MNKKVLFVFGTRPEAIKMAPLVKAFQAASQFDTKVCVTAQHREMLDQVLDFFEIIPDFDLNIMEPNQTLNSITAKILLEMKPVLDTFNPDLVFVHGDTTTTMAASLAAFYSGAKIGHIEAGLRTFNKRLPFPEESNRRITSVVADYHFAPTQTSKDNLLRENVAEDSILVTGNTVIDALLESVEIVKDLKHPEIDMLKALLQEGQEVLLITGHRRENHGDGFIQICEALKEIALKNPSMLLIYPVHLNPNVLEPVNRILGMIPNIKLIHPLSYPAFIWLMNRSKIIITDSGGVQEEAPSLGKPVLVMRETTERPEAVEAGTVILVGTDKEKIVRETQELIENSSKMERMSQLHNPYGDGAACSRIVAFVSKL